MLRHEWFASLFFAHLVIAALVRRRMPSGVVWWLARAGGV